MTYAAEGGQALHLMEGWFANHRKDTPNCFKGRKQIAHLFDQDRARLVACVKRLGVRVIQVERAGEPGQHIDLCGKPLDRALQEAGLGPAKSPVAPADSILGQTLLFPS